MLALGELMPYGNMTHQDNFKINMRKIVLIAITLFLSYFSHAQLLDNKINIYIGYNQGAFHGKEMVNEGSFISPSLYPNYNDLTELSFKALVKRNKFYSLGLGFNNLNASAWNTTSGWNMVSFRIYNNSKIKQYSLTPTIQIHNKFAKTGVFNRIKLFFEIAPTIGLSELTLVYPLFDIQNQNEIVSQPMNSRDIFYGIESNVGFELSITRTFGLFFSYSIQQNWVKSKLYNDNKFFCSNIGLGLVIRLIQNKRFYY